MSSYFSCLSFVTFVYEEKRKDENFKSSKYHTRFYFSSLNVCLKERDCKQDPSRTELAASRELGSFWFWESEFSPSFQAQL